MELVLTGVLTFLSTNLDDLFLLLFFFGDRSYRKGEVIAGQFLGMAALIAISLAGSLVGLVLEQAYTGLLGLVPLAIGISGVFKLFREKDDPEATGENRISKGPGTSRILTVAGSTLANGGDNIGIYIPLFATLGWGQKTVMILVFFLLTYTWCLSAQFFSGHPLLLKPVRKWGHRTAPFVLIALGVYILYENRTFSLLIK